MTTIKYDGTFQGLLSAIYDIYLWKIENPVITSRFENYKTTMFGETYTCDACTEKAERVKTKIKTLSNKSEIHFLYSCFLSEKKDVEQLIYRYCRNLIRSKGKSSYDLGIDCTQRLRSISKKVTRETHRMKAFIRFHEIGNQLYFANCTPDFDVLPLISSHFENRYQDQQWVIYDLSRNYGIHYDLNTCKMVNITFNDASNHRGITNGLDTSNLVTDAEKEFNTLWKIYFDKVNIPSRKNMKLHVQHIPKRYWKYMNEKG